MCRQYGKPLWVITGRCQVPENEYRSLGITRVLELSTTALPEEHPISDAPAIIRRVLSTANFN